MSSSQQSTNSNNNQSQTSSHAGLDDYELDPSMQSMSGYVPFPIHLKSDRENRIRRDDDLFKKTQLIFYSISLNISAQTTSATTNNNQEQTDEE